MFKLLIVDDEPDVLEALAFTLHHDFQIETARDGVAALELLDTQTFDVVLLDYTMPRLDGAGVIQALRERHNGVPILLSSALPELAALAASLGVESLSKPYDIDRLVDRLQALAAAGESDCGLYEAQGF